MTKPVHIDAEIERFLATMVPASPAALAKWEALRAREERADRLRMSGILDVVTEGDAARIVADRLDATPALDVVRRWLAHQRTAGGKVAVLGLVGDKGVGKTVAAAWAIASLGGTYVDAEQLCRWHAARWGNEAAEYTRVSRSHLLVVDEVGTEESAERAAAALHDVVNRRQAKLTLMLGNASKAEFLARLDPRTIDRLRACGRVLRLAGASLRKGDL